MNFFEYRKNAFPYLVTALAGLLLAIFGVFMSVFSDGSSYERIITVLVVLIIYGILGIVIGIWKPVKTYVFLPWLSFPGVLVLLFYMNDEGFDVFYIPYIILIITVSFFGLYTGRSFKHKKK